MKKMILFTLLFMFIPSALSATYIIEHRTNGTGGSGNVTINNYYNNGSSINISGVTNSTQYFVVDTAPTSNFGNGFPQFFHDEATGVHTLGLGTLPSEGNPGLLTASDYTTFNNKVSSQWTSFGTTFPRGIYYQDSGINQVFMGDSFDVSNTTQLNNFGTALTGPAVIYYDAFGASKKPHVNAGYLGFGYPLSIQKAATDSYLEISNWNGENQGVFFGNYDKNFEMWDYSGGHIIFYTSNIPSDGTERVRITANGSLVTGGGGGSGAFDTWTNYDLISWKVKVRNELNASIVNTSNLCINGDCKTAWPASGSDNTTFNQSLTDSLYYPKNTNPLDYYNSTNKQPETDPLWSGNQSLYYPVASTFFNVTTANEYNGAGGTTLRNITGLKAPLLANTNYAFDCEIFFSSRNTTNGLSIAFEDWGGTVDYFNVNGIVRESTATTALIATVNTTATKITSTGVTTINVVYGAEFSGYINNGASNIIWTPQFSSEVATHSSHNITIWRNSNCDYKVVI